MARGTSLMASALTLVCVACDQQPPAAEPAEPASRAEQPAPARPSELPREPEPPALDELPLRLFKNEDSSTPIKDSKSRLLIIEGGLGEEGLRRALTSYYKRMRMELEGSRNPTRHIWLFAYPSETRAAAGLGEWEGRAKAMAFDGKPLPPEPELSIRLPAKDADQPTARENEIYDDLMAELGSVDSAGAYQEKVLAKRPTLTKADIAKMADLEEKDEKRAMRKVARRHEISARELEALPIKVLGSRM